MTQDTPPSPDANQESSVIALLATYRQKGIKLWADQGKLKFKAPEGALTPDLKKQLKENKAAILAFFARLAENKTDSIIAPRPDRGPAPLSFGQQGLWFLDQFRPGDTISSALVFEGPLCVAYLEAAFQAVVNRHDSLRTTFQVQDGDPVQVVQPQMPFQFGIADLTAMDPDAAVRQIAASLPFSRFDLAQLPLLRATLLHTAPQRHILLVVMHHIISDGWSISVLIDEVRRHYTHAVAHSGQVATLPELPVQYADFAYWQRTKLSDEVLADKLRWWQDYLHGLPEMTVVPTDRPRAATQDTRGDRVQLVFAGLRPQVEALGRQVGGTTFMVLLSAYFALLSRMTGNHDLAVGTPLAGRRRAELEPLIGYFINMLTLRGNTDGNPTFTQLLTRVRDQTVKAYDYQEVPFDKIVDAVRPARASGYAPLFQLSFSLQNMPPAEDNRLPHLRMTPLVGDETNTNYDIAMLIYENDRDFQVTFEYSVALFHKRTVQRLADRFQRLLTHCVTAPDTPVRRLNLMHEAERTQVLTRWNQTQTDVPAQQPLGVLFAEQAARNGRQPAVIMGDAVLTYGALETQANQLAHELTAWGVVAGRSVGLLLKDGRDLAVAALAVVKLGAVYVPMDPDDPGDRLQFMMEDTDMPLVITRSHFGETLPSLFTCMPLMLDEQTFDALPETPPEVTVDGDFPLYIMYTSGSTGKPKGTIIPHHAVTRLVRNNPFLCLDSHSRVGQIANVVFDAFTLELWGPLLNGGAMVGSDRETRLDTQRFAAWLRCQGVTDMFVTVSLFNRIISEKPDTFATMNTLLVGGEALDPHAIRACLAAGPPQRLLNGYGPTENTTFSTTRHITELAADATSVPIGAPIGNSTAYVLDPQLRPVGLGMQGELCLGGDGLAQGYLNRPGLTAEKFVPHPYASQPGLRLYRSGDLVQAEGDDTQADFRFFGRIDTQIKLRGLRIELGEIEAALQHAPGVREAAVLLREEGEKRLVAYLVTDETNLSLDAVKDHIRQDLPDYMMPAVYVRLDAFPLTPNGKLDRRALPAPDTAASLEADTFMAPRTPVEQELARHWAEILDLPRVSITGDFFDLGGHSLLATRVLSHVRAVYNQEIPLADLFANPTIEALAAQIDASGESRPEMPPMEPLPRDAEGQLLDPAPMSFAQQRLWFLDQMLHESNNLSHAYNMPFELILTGAPAMPAMDAAQTWLVTRHESLRTSFTATDAGDLQVVAPPSPQVTGVIDLSGLDPSERDAAATGIAARHAQRAFDLRTGPLFTMAMLRLTSTQHHLMLNMHHIISDGWSLSIVVRELMAAYKAYAAGRHHQPEPPALQYADFSAWQRRFLSGDALDQRLTWWQDQLAGAPPLLELPTDFPRPAHQQFAGEAQPVVMSPRLTQQLKQLAGERECTLYMLLEAAFSVLLYRLSGVEDMVIGMPIANRNHPEVEPMIGFFVNTLALRHDLSGNPSFTDYLEICRQNLLQAYQHQDIPLDQVIEAVQPERNPSHAPLFQVVFLVQNQPVEAVNLPGLKAELKEVAAATAKFDLTCAFQEIDDRLVGAIEYSTSLFHQATIELTAKRYLTILEHLVAAPQTPLALIPVMDAAERAQLLTEWSAGGQPPVAPATVPQRIAATAQRHPHRTALIFGKERLTYAAMDQRVDALAYRLRHMGVGPETSVAVLMQRSMDMVLGVLAVHRAGGAYIPLDAANPEARLRHIITTAGAKVVLVHQATADLLPDLPLLKVDASCDPPPSRFQPPLLTAENTAYILFTSGSTGTPKGVIMHHAPLRNLISWAARALPLHAEDRVALKATLAFDASVLEMFWPLDQGAQLVITHPDRSLAAELCEHGVTACFSVPTQTRAMLDEPGFLDNHKLRLIMCGGEVVPPELRDRLMAVDGLTMTAVYGPTETCVYASMDRCVAGEPGPLSIGSPLDHTRYYVLDALGNPAPIGVPGELCIGGITPARGYLAEPAKTAVVFVPDPFGKEAGARMYRTGDLVRYLPRGGDSRSPLAYVGRIDHQIKLRGLRIELGEIEAVLATHPALSGVVVLLREVIPNNPQIIAYAVTPQPEDDTVLVEELKQLAADRLPTYMVPGYVMLLSRLPYKSMGKLDTAALPLPNRAATTASGYVAPVSETEKHLVAIWEEVLDLDRVGTQDNFFDLGGHSLLATRVISRIRQELEADIILAQFFASPTPAGLAQQIQTRVRKEPLMVPVPRTAEGLPAQAPPVSYSQQRLWFLDHLSPAGSALSLAYNMPLVLSLEGPGSPLAMQTALTTLITRHESLRTSFAAQGEAAVQIIAPPKAQQVQLVDLSGLSQAERKSAAQVLADQHARTVFNLKTGPLFDALLVRLTPNHHHLMLNMHHIISDGWSMGVLARELMTVYNATAAGKTPTLPNLPLQYTDFAAWQRDYLSGQVLAQRLDFWKQSLADAPALLPLPTDRPRPAFQQFDGATVSLVLDPDLSGKLNALAATRGCTLYMVLEAAFAVLLHRLSGTQDLVIGTPIANRNRAETEALIGFFVNTLALRHDLSGNPRFTDFLADSRQTLLQAYDHQDVPLEQVIDVVQPERNPSHAPLFQVLFSLQNMPVETMALPGLKTAPIEVETATAKFDLTLALQEKDNTIIGALEYSTALFDAATMTQWLERYQILLADLVAHPLAPVDDLSIMHTHERQRMLEEWSRGATPEAPTWLAPQRIADVAQQVPNRIALHYREEQLTYARMDERVEALAHRLRTMGVGPERVVAVLLQRSVDMVISLLAVQRAGGAYMPLDPTNPKARLEYILATAGAMFVLVHEATLDILPEQTLVRVDQPMETPATRVAIPPLDPQHAAYVLFTSGSTGTPKGVVMSHGPLRNLLTWVQNAFQLTPEDRVAFKAPLMFDVSVMEVFGTLGNGAQVVVTDPEQPLGSEICKHKATILVGVPTQNRAVMEEPGFMDNQQLRLMFSCGEALTTEMRDRHLAMEGLPLINAYGPTETCVLSAIYTCKGDEAGPMPIGDAVDHTRLYVLDQRGLPTPMGINGELCIGGITPARGYLGRPALTAATFVPDAYSGVPGARLYRTGDSVRYPVAHGEEKQPLLYFGRIDQQVKLRGFRIELEEIEVVLGKHTALSGVAVLVREVTPGNPQLVAYAATKDTPDDEAGLILELKELAAKHLPHYMVPGYFLLMEALPFKAAGKLNRAALPMPGREATTAADYVAPASELEQTIAGVWQDVLGLEKVGSQDNFFDLGGHSILLIQLHKRLQEALQREVELVQLIANPTVASQALLTMPPALTPAKKKTDHGARRRDASKKKKDQWKKRRGKR